MKHRDYPLAPTHFDGPGDPPKKKKPASSTPAHTKRVVTTPTLEQQGVLTRKHINEDKLRQVKAQTTDPSIIAPYQKKFDMSRDSANAVYRSQVQYIKVPAKKVAKSK